MENLNPVPLGKTKLNNEELDELFDYANRLTLGVGKFEHRKGRLIQILINAYINACKDASDVPQYIRDAIGGTNE